MLFTADKRGAKLLQIKRFKDKFKARLEKYKEFVFLNLNMAP